ncbi:LysR family transcriptional regulator [Sphingomonas cavernae]|uniref:LysR family transcriptional regulator n=1 Tax=Sphingomonas cavernae TaxID=2320861 RepID=A0A418WNT2_9SPHN|nr:LysR family transcriptional regulator [Sphingomonas cavernae]RJF92893.1 LysR family transcriptional regulator [Sphingomonas cavernae]
MLDWNDLRYFLAVARTGSTLAAGRALRVSQTTAARRVAALEQTVGLPLFERRQTGYFLTPAGEALVERAEAVEAAANAFTDSAGSQGREVTGTVRLTAQEIHAVTVLAPILRDLHEANPAIRIELDTSDAMLDLAAGAADVALRSVERPEGGGLVGRRITIDDWAIYCSRDYAAAHGRPRRRRELAGHPFIGGGGAGVWKIYRAWLEENGLVDAIAMHHDSPTGLLSAVRSGIGLAVLPCFVADTDPDLVRCLPPTHGKERGIWLLTHERVRHTPRVRVVIDFLAERLAGLAQAQQRGVIMPPGAE